MKKIISVFVLLIMIFLIVNIPAMANNSTEVVYIVNGTKETKVSDLIIGDTFVPDRFPSVIPKGKIFVGWRSEEGKMADSNGIVLQANNNNLYAVFESKYLINKNATILENRAFDKRIFYPYIYNNSYYGSIFYEINGGYGPKEFVYEGENAPYTRFVSGQYNGKGVAFLFDKNGAALKGEWNKTYEITIEYRLPSIETKIHLQPTFGLKTELAQGTSSDKMNQGKILLTGHTSGLVRSWGYDVKGGYEYWFSKNSEDELNTVENGFDEFKRVTFTIKTGEENADYLPIFGIYVNVGGGNNANTIDIKNITVTEQRDFSVRYVVDGETVAVAENVEKGTVYTVDYVANNTETHYFAGWYLDKDYKISAPSSFDFEEKTILYAKMEEYKKKVETSSFMGSESFVLTNNNTEPVILRPDAKYKLTLNYTFDNSQNAGGYAEYCLNTGISDSEKVRLEPTEKQVELYVNTLPLSTYTDKLLKQYLTVNGFVSENCNICIKSAELCEISPVISGGVSMLKNFNPNNSQALRLYFAYDTTNGADIFTGNTQCEVISRGILVAKGFDANYDIKREDADGKYIHDLNTTDLYNCWNINSYNHTKEQLYYSCYISEIKAENGMFNSSLRFYARGYVVYENSGTFCVAYSELLSYTVKEVAVLNNYHNEGSFALTTDKNRKLVWNVEFETEKNIAEVDTKLNAGPQTMTADNVTLFTKKDDEHYFLNSGDLVLRMTKNNENNTFTTAPGITTINRMSFKYGYLEMRAKCPYQYGMWFSFWMQPDKKLLPDNYRYAGEIDIIETWWQSRSSYFALYKWYDNYKGSITQHENNVDTSRHEGKRQFVFPQNKNLKNEYHVYGMEWTPEYIKAYVDGNNYYPVYIDEASDFAPEVPGMECFHDYYYLCWNNWMHTSYAEDLEFENGYADYAIDYVRLYQNENEDIVVY